MKKFILIALAAILFAGCSKEEKEKTSDLMVNVKLEGRLASRTLVMLYDYEEAKDFDRSNFVQMGFHQELTDKEGNLIEPVYVSESLTGVNTFYEINNGKYIIVVMHIPEGYTFPAFYYYGYKIVDVDYTTLFVIDFTYGDFGKFIQF